MKIALYGSRRQQAFLAPISAFLDAAAARGITLVMHPKIYAHLQQEIPLKMSSPGFIQGDASCVDTDADYVVSLGGDGTFLRTAAWVGAAEIPILGVNTGHLGYLTALGIEDLPAVPAALEEASGLFRAEPRQLIAVEAPALHGSGIWPYALNEVAFLRCEDASIMEAEVRLDGSLLATYRADGLIVCTPTGSTAYNLSIGGPLVQPELDVRVIAPVAAHSLSMRPLVVAGRSDIQVLCNGRAPHIRLALDGRSVTVDCGTPVLLAPAQFHILVMQPRTRSFADALREKLHWGEE